MLVIREIDFPYDRVNVSKNLQKFKNWRVSVVKFEQNQNNINFQAVSDLHIRISSGPFSNLLNLSPIRIRFRGLCFDPAQCRTFTSEHALHLLQEKTCAVRLFYSTHCKLMHSVKGPMDNPQCFLSSLLICRTYSSGPSSRSWLVPYLSRTIRSVCFFFIFEVRSATD